MNTLVRRFVEYCYRWGVSKIVLGDLTGIRKNSSKGRRVNSMVHNFWSHRYLVERVKTTAEECGIKVKRVDEAYT